jgi:lysozyme
MATFIGVDVSRYQGDINYDLLKTSVSFVIYKGTGADDGLYADAKFLENHAEARRVGIHRGIYHFGGGNEDATVEAHYFYQQCLTNLLPGEVVALDAEYGFARRPDWCLVFLQTLENLIGFKPMLYINEALLLSQDWSAVAAGNYGLWLADWTGDPNLIVQMKFWAFCALQQFTDKGTIAGIAGAVDEDGFFANDMSFFDKYGKPADAAPAAPTPPVIAPIPAPEIPVPTVDPTPAPTPVTEPPVTPQPVIVPVDPVKPVELPVKLPVINKPLATPHVPWYILAIAVLKRFFHLKV